MIYSSVFNLLVLSVPYLGKYLLAIEMQLRRLKLYANSKAETVDFGARYVNTTKLSKAKKFLSAHHCIGMELLQGQVARCLGS
jgi:hypothetical protein